MEKALLVAILLSANSINHALAGDAERSLQRLACQWHVLAILRRSRDAKVLLLENDISILIFESGVS